MTNDLPGVIQLRAAGVAAVFDVGGQRGTPRLLHWGADLGELSPAGLAALLASSTPPVLNSSFDVPRRLGLTPGEHEGWSGSPGVEGHRDGAHAALRFELAGTSASETELELDLVDAATGLHLKLHYALSRAGVMTVGAALTNRAGAGQGAAPYDLTAVRLMLPIPAEAQEILDLTGKWCRERAPQRVPVRDGAHRRAVRRGRPGHDSPLLTIAGTPGFGFRSGEVWGVHLAWSGDQEYFVERLQEGAGVHSAVLGVGELLRPGEIRLSPGETYRSPEAHFVWSADGMDGLSARMHAHLRARAGHPRSPRPVVLNTWEAVYFDHDAERLRALADRAAEVGVERFVLDDGWFRSRRNDAAGLGDWTVDADVWPDGLRPLSDHVHGLGMQFGLWVEPEMVNLDSDLVRAHPDWVLAPSAGVSLPWRHQYVLNLAHPDAWDYLLDRLDRLVGDYAVDYLKWDHNRDLHEAVTRAAGADRPGVHAQTAALYSLVDALRSRHPALEIESCASGGARVDLGILARTDRIWASDCNDPVERQQIQRWTGLLVPPELVGTHVGPEESHTTRRSTYLSFRLATALFGHAGIEWDLTRSTREELDAITRWIALHQELRPLLHSGVTVRADLADDATLLHGVVSGDRKEAVFCWARVATSGAAHAGRVRFPGLDPKRTYVVRVLDGLGAVAAHEIEEPAWFAAARGDGLAMPGSVLTAAGVPLPTLNPAQALVLHLT